jgi:hypothetical protein
VAVVARGIVDGSIMTAPVTTAVSAGFSSPYTFDLPSAITVTAILFGVTLKYH